MYHTKDMSKLNTSTPSGFPEFSPAEEAIRQKWIKTISETFSAHGFQPISTPLVEREENLLSKGGNPKEIYALKRIHDEGNDTSHSGNALRFDHTVPLALYVARHMNDITFPFRRQAIGPVLRGERAQKGRFRQFDQCDIDIIGSESLSFFNDAEVVAIIANIFTKLNIGDFVIRINNRKILTGLFEGLGISGEKIKPVLDIVDDLEKLSQKKIKDAFVREGISEAVSEKILRFTEIKGDNQSIFQELKSFSENETYQQGISELKTVLTGIKALKIPEKMYQIDPSIARGLDYYTGTVYETKLIEYPGLGSICSGGRYEDLAEVFTGKKLPGVGISIGLTRLLWQLFDAKIIVPQKSSPSDILLIAHDDEFLPDVMGIADQLRTQNISTEIYFESKKFKKKMDYADKNGIPFVGILGEDEVAQNTIVLKNMATGEQQTISQEKMRDIAKVLSKE